MLNENIENSNYYKKCEGVKDFFLKDENFKHKKNNVNQINQNIKDIKDIFHSFCNYSCDNEIMIDYRYLKIIEKINGFDNDFIIDFLIKKIQTILQKKSNNLIIHVCLQSLTLTDIEKHYKFIYKLSEELNDKIPDLSEKLEKCFLYKAPFIISHLFSILSTIVNKKTLSNVQIIK